MIPLRFYLIAHSASKPSQRLAEALMLRFMDPPASGGLRVPVQMMPDRGDGLPPQWDKDASLNLAEHTIVVVLADSVSMQTVANGQGEGWREFYCEGIAKVSGDDSSHNVIGVAVGDDGFKLSNNRDLISVAEPPWEDEVEDDFEAALDEWIEQELDSVALEVTLSAIRLLYPKLQQNADDPPLRLFLSHAKANLSEDDDHPLRIVQRAIRDLPITGWFDAANIPTSAEFSEAIEKGLKDCSIVIAFLTDDYASRIWCQREILDAKRLGVPILVVIALEIGEVRSFPYLGNVPTLCCRSSQIDSIGEKVVSYSVRETLRALHNRLTLAGQTDPDEVPLASPPEAATLAYRNAKKFVYPDPPLTEAEHALIKELRPDAEFLTPLIKLAKGQQPDKTVLAVSAGNSSDLARYGLTKHHEKTLEEELYLYLITSGFQIAYGGALQGDYSKANGNFTKMLFEIDRNYSDLVRQAGANRVEAIVNYAPWPLHVGYGRKEHRLFRNADDLIQCPAPDSAEVPESIDELFPIPEKKDAFRFKSMTVQQRLAWTRGLTAMRALMTEGCAARLAIGGKLRGFSGIYPGIVEEAWMSLASGRPLFLIGAFGGAAAAVIAALQGNASRLADEMREATDLQETLDLASSRGIKSQSAGEASPLYTLGKILHPNDMIDDIVRCGAAGLSAALNNGLKDKENQELFSSAHPPRITELIITGMSRTRAN